MEIGVIERRVLEFLNSKPQRMEVVIDGCCGLGVDQLDITGALFCLELEGRILQLEGKRFVLKEQNNGSTSAST